MTPKTQAGILVLVLAQGLAGCSTAMSPDAPGTTSSNAPTYTLSGVISTGGGGVPLGLPVQGVRVQVEQQGQGHVRVDAMTDVDGLYTVSGLGPGLNDVSTIKDGYVNYTSRLNVSGQMRLNIGVQPLAIYTLSGVVSELTEAGLVPVEGVQVNEGYKDEFSVTDSTGHYSVSELYPSPIAFYAGFDKNGYQSQMHIVTIDGDTRLDVQLSRR